MLHRNTLLLCALMCISMNIFGITINSNLSNLAGIDIYILKNAPSDIDSLGFVMNQMNTPIATYSFAINQSNQIQLWRAFYDPASLLSMVNNMFLSPIDRAKGYQTLSNPFTIELSQAEIEELIGESPSQIYVAILQRTYYFDASVQKIFLFNRIVLESDMYCVSDTINLEADGIINQTMWNVLPDYLKNIYYPATGAVS